MQPTKKAPLTCPRCAGTGLVWAAKRVKKDKIVTLTWLCRNCECFFEQRAKQLKRAS